jgi:opacity protein-like surface antigen
MSIKKNFTLIILGILFCSSLTYADKQNDFFITQATERYFRMPYDAKALSTGGASSQVCEGAACIFMNPAGLGFMNSYGLSGTLGNSSKDGVEFFNEDQFSQIERSGFLAGAIPLGENSKYGVLSLGYSRFYGQTNDEISTDVDGFTETFGYSLALNENLSLGYSVTFFDDQLRTELSDLHSHSRFLHLFSVQAKLGDGIKLGGTFRLGIGQSDTEDFVLESNGLSNLRQYSGDIALSKDFDCITGIISFSYSFLSSRSNDLPFSEPVVFGGDEKGEDYNLGIGIEYNITDQIPLRAGYRYRHADYSFYRPGLETLGGTVNANGWSTGVGYVFNQGEYPVKLDYGFDYSSAGYGAVQHLVSLSVLF